MGKSIVTIAIVCVATFLPLQSRADSWAAATPKVVASPDGETLVRVEPGESLGDTVGFAGAGKGAFARATYYRRNTDNGNYEPARTISLDNPVSPVDTYLNNAGILVTLDNWHNAGYGKVVVIYDRDGKLLRSYELEDLYSESAVGRILTSVSSRWWRCASVMPWISDGEFWLRDSFGGEFRFDLSTGNYTYEESPGSCMQN